MIRTKRQLILTNETSDKKTPCYSKSQKDLADKAQEIIVKNIYQHITIAEMSNALHVSPTQLKSSFRNVYGMPVYSYAKAHRMKAASRLLLDTDDPVLEIAGRFGYENGSKFAHAFRTVIGVTPTEYRKRNRGAE